MLKHITDSLSDAAAVRVREACHSVSFVINVQEQAMFVKENAVEW